MKITSQFTVECGCRKFQSTTTHEYQAVKALFDHVRAEHPERFERLQKRGRKLAQSQNGLGYFDSGRPENDGWHNAQETFRDAWAESALKEKLNLRYW